MADAVDRILAQWQHERPDLDATPMGVIGRISRAESYLAHALAPVFAEFDLQAGEFDLLATLRRSGTPFRLRVGDLVQSSMVTSGAVTQRLDRLEVKELVAREPDPASRRSVIVSLTRRGRRIVDAALEAHLANEQAQLSGLTDREQEQLARLLRKLLHSLDDV